MRFTDKSVIITGGGGKIGKAYAMAFAKEGAKVCLPDIASADHVVKAIQDMEGTAISMKCDVTDEKSVKAMVDVQRARDAQMAQSLIAAGNPDGAVLVAGAGHVRNDYGIPVYLTAKAAGKQVISIAFVEVDDQKPEPRNYALANGRLPFDYVWFTARVDDENPCEKFKSQFEQLKKRSDK